MPTMSRRLAEAAMSGKSPPRTSPPKCNAARGTKCCNAMLWTCVLVIALMAKKDQGPGSPRMIQSTVPRR